VLGAYANFATTFYFPGEFESARQYARHGVQLSRLGDLQSHAEDYLKPVVSGLIYWAMSEWRLGEITSCHALMEEGISIAKELKDMNSLAMTPSFAAFLGYLERDPAKVDRFASKMIELSTRHNFAFWPATGQIYRGWRAALPVTQPQVFRE
jgi:hypothetical protein